jgi:hypothetical protein
LENTFVQLTNFMRKIVITALAICAVSFVFAQDSTIIKKTTTAVTYGGNDHLLLQFGYNAWGGKPDSIRTKGFSRTFNAYIMFAFPFKTNPHISVALGPGIATDHVFLDEMSAGLADNTSKLVFADVSDTNHFKKYKVATAFLEAPVELRFRSNPNDDRHSFKVALGAKVATLLSAWVKAKDLQNKSDNLIKGFIYKEKNKHFFNSTRLSVMGRIGYGNFSVFGSYAITALLKEGVGPTLHPFSIGLTLSGL